MINIIAAIMATIINFKLDAIYIYTYITMKKVEIQTQTQIQIHNQQLLRLC